jgi:hypothetical protein
MPHRSGVALPLIAALLCPAQQPPQLRILRPADRSIWKGGAVPVIVK